MISARINLEMTVIGFTVSIMFIVFICTRLVCARIQLIASQRSFPTASRSDLSILKTGLHGLEPVSIANFPTKKYTDECFSATEYARCTVCLSEYHGEDILRILPYCGHSFHVTCIDIWLQHHSTCPVCRLSLHEFPPEKKRLMQPLFSTAIPSHFVIVFQYAFLQLFVGRAWLSVKNPLQLGDEPNSSEFFCIRGQWTRSRSRKININ